jgi:hypothetical protein
MNNIIIYRLHIFFLTLRSHGGGQVEQDTDMLSFSDRVKCVGHDIHMLFVKRSDVKKAEVVKDDGKELVFR